MIEWFFITEPPAVPTKVLMYSAEAEFWDSNTGKFVDAPKTEIEKLEEPRYDVGYWNGMKFYYDGSNEEVFEFAGEGSTKPTHWMKITPPA